MPISKKHKLCFVHIPKTAGTTIEKALDMHQEDSFFLFKKFKDYKVTPQHLTLTELSEEIDLNGYKIFTIVRNPFDRIVSEFAFHTECRMTKDYHHLNFSEFVDTCLKLDQEQRKWIFDGHLELQVDYIRSELPVKIFKYENLQECFDWLKEQTGENLKFGHEKKSNKKSPFSLFTDSLMQNENFYDKICKKL